MKRLLGIAVLCLSCSSSQKSVIVLSVTYGTTVQNPDLIKNLQVTVGSITKDYPVPGAVSFGNCTAAAAPPCTLEVDTAMGGQLDISVVGVGNSAEGGAATALGMGSATALAEPGKVQTVPIQLSCSNGCGTETDGSAGVGGGLDGSAGSAGQSGNGGVGGSTASMHIQILEACNGIGGQSIGGELEIVNTGTLPVNLANVALRYYFNRGDGSSAVTGELIASNPTILPSTIVYSYTKSGNGASRQYAAIAFTQSAGTLAPGATQAITALVSSSDDSGSFDPTPASDYSFQTCVGLTNANAYIPWPKITGYLNGTLDWGTEPTTDAGTDQ